LKDFSQYGVATENNGSLWWLMVVVGDGESTWDVRNVFGRKKGEEKTFFLSYAKAKAEMLK